MQGRTDWAMKMIRYKGGMRVGIRASKVQVNFKTGNLTIKVFLKTFGS